MVQLTEVNIYSPDVYTERLPHDVSSCSGARPRCTGTGKPNGPGFWALTKYDDIVTVSQDSATFSSARAGTNIDDLPPDALAMIQTLMLNMDPPKHTLYRRLVATGFTPAMIRKLEPHVRDITTRIIDEVAERGACDFVTEVAAELPLQVIAEMIGVPHEERHMLFDWSNRLIGFDDPEFTTSPEDGRVAATELFMYAHQLASQRKQEPRDDLISVLLQAEVEGEELSEPEFDAFFILLVRGRQRDDAQPDRRRHAGVHGAPGAAPAADRRPIAHAGRGRGDAALGFAADLLPAHRDARHGGPRPAHPRRREGGHVLPLGESRRGRVRERRHASTSAAIRTRTWRSAAAATTSASAPAWRGWRSE